MRCPLVAFGMANRTQSPMQSATQSFSSPLATNSPTAIAQNRSPSAALLVVPFGCAITPRQLRVLLSEGGRVVEQLFEPLRYRSNMVFLCKEIFEFPRALDFLPIVPAGEVPVPFPRSLAIFGKLAHRFNDSRTLRRLRLDFNLHADLGRVGWLFV